MDRIEHEVFKEIGKLDCVRQLPIIGVEEEEGKKFFFDEKLRQLRNTENPHDYIDLNEFELAYFKAKAEKVENDAKAERIERTD